MGNTKKTIERHGECTKRFANKNGLSKYNASRLYRTWHHMKDIKECAIWPDWEKSFTEFRKWAIRNGWDESLGAIHLRRISKTVGFVPGNVIISTLLPMERIFLTKDGMTMTLSNWARYLGVSKQVIWSRINKLKWSVEDALTKNILHNEESTFDAE